MIAQLGRVDVDRHGRLAARVDHPVDVARHEVEDVARLVGPRGHASKPSGQMRSSRSLSLDDRDRARGQVVIVEAGVVARHPADQPRLGAVGASSGTKIRWLESCRTRCARSRERPREVRHPGPQGFFFQAVDHRFEDTA